MRSTWARRRPNSAAPPARSAAGGRSWSTLPLRRRAAAAAIPSRGAAAGRRLGRRNVFTGLGFDACTAPSSKTMAAWGASPYRAVGVYIGGVNRACSQPNLTASWVSAQTVAGWHLIPTYVGLQAPTSSCGSCAKLSAAQAGRAGDRGRARRGRPGERGRDRGRQPDLLRHGVLRADSSASAATLAFLEAWTDEAARARLRLRRLQQQRLRDRRPRRRSSPAATNLPTTSGSPTGTASRTPPTPSSPPAPGPTTSASTSTAAATTRSTAG